MKWFGIWCWNRLASFKRWLCKRASALWHALRRSIKRRGMAVRRFCFANRHRGEVAAVINHAPRRLRLTLSALAQLESAYGETDILELVRGFAAQGLSARDVDLVLRAGLTGAGDELAHSAAALDVEGGYAAAAQLAARLLAAAFGEEAEPQT